MIGCLAENKALLHTLYFRVTVGDPPDWHMAIAAAALPMYCDNGSTAASARLGKLCLKMVDVGQANIHMLNTTGFAQASISQKHMCQLALQHGFNNCIACLLMRDDAMALYHAQHLGSNRQQKWKLVQKLTILGLKLLRSLWRHQGCRRPSDRLWLLGTHTLFGLCGIRVGVARSKGRQGSVAG